jgi:hypothetical protein
MFCLIVLRSEKMVFRFIKHIYPYAQVKSNVLAGLNLGEANAGVEISLQRVCSAFWSRLIKL